jgi:hypothetical protein
MNETTSFPTWKTITIGNYKSTSALEKAILDSGFRIGSWANDVLKSPHFTLAPQERKIDLVRITPKDLGFENGAYRKDVYKRAREVGLELCPLEIGPQLRLQYTDQPRLETLQIGMEPQVDSEGHESEFRIVHGGDGFIWLVGDHKHPDDFWKADEYFIFVKD